MAKLAVCYKSRRKHHGYDCYDGAIIIGAGEALSLSTMGHVVAQAHQAGFKDEFGVKLRHQRSPFSQKTPCPRLMPIFCRQNQGVHETSVSDTRALMFLYSKFCCSLQSCLAPSRANT